jgi:catechol 2,3-dioxygenase-like lactoylglutathione lyase family enzyme
MATQELHRGRLIDHLQLVVKDLAASKRFYSAVFKVIEIPLAGEGDDYFWADELFISTQQSTAA